MELFEADIEIDQVIYVKAVEVQENSTHKDLKDFIALWIGGLRIAMIGERPKDSGLKNLLVEPAIFGM